MRIEPARLTHVGPIAANMREADRRECWALGRTPKEALRMGLRVGLHTFTAVDDDRTPFCMFGLFAGSVLTGEATPWLLGTDAVFRRPRELLTIGRPVIEWWREEFPRLSNIVSVENVRAIRLLRAWGAEIGGEEQLHRGIAFVPFVFPAIQAAARPA